MPMLRVPIAVCAVVLTAAMLTGCLGTRLDPAAPKGVRLQGVWKLNRAASDDPQKIIAAMRQEALKKIHRAMNAPPPMATGGGGGPRHRGQGQGQSQSGTESPDDASVDAMPQQGPGGDPLRNSPTMHALREILERSDYLTIRQSADQVAFDYGIETRSYTPGVHSVVSSENGVADQTSGWKGKEYVIDVKPQLGPVIVEEYGLSPDGKQLIVKIRLGPFELSRVNLTQVFDATGAAIPNTGPSND